MPQTVARSEGFSWVLTAAMRHAGGVAMTLAERVKRAIKTVDFRATMFVDKFCFVFACTGMFEEISAEGESRDLVGNRKAVMNGV